MPTIDLSPTTQDGLSFLVQNFNEGKAPEDQLNGDDYIFDPPASIQGSPDPREAVLRVRPVAGSGRIGRIAINYFRIDTTTWADYHHDDTGTSLMVSDILNDINTAFGVSLSEADIVDVAIPPAGEVVQVVIRPDSYLFTGQFSIVVD